MRFKLAIDCDNAAFEDEPLREVAASLRRLADHIEGMTQGYPMGNLRDTNGNTVGCWSLAEPLGEEG